MRTILRYAQEEHNIHGVRETVKRLITYCKDRKIDKVLDTLYPPATSAEISAMEKELSVKLPSDFVEFLKLHNGTGNSGYDLMGFGINTIKEMLRQNNSNNKIENFDDFDIDKPVGDPGVKSVYWDKNWVLFTGAGEHGLALDMSPASGGKKGQIIRWGYEGGPRKLVAPSFAAWLDKEVEDFIQDYEKKLEKENKNKDTPASKKSWWPW